MSSDWRNGFLFVGNHRALDFLNTRPVMDGQPVELLPTDPPSHGGWSRRVWSVRRNRPGCSADGPAPEPQEH